MRTKRIYLYLLVSIVTVLHTIPTFADAYRVSDRTLNVWETPSRQGNTVMQLNYGDLVEVVDSAADDWVCIQANGKTGYVWKIYLTPDSEFPEEDKAENLSKSRKFIQWLKPDLNSTLGHDSRWPVYLGLILGILVAGFSLFRNDDDANPLAESGLTYIATFAFIGLCICEIYHFRGYEGDPTWFCSPSLVGWLWTIINFILFSLIVVGQFVAMLTLLADLDALAGRFCNWIWCYGLIGFSIVVLIVGIFVPVALTVGGIILVGSQIVWPLWMMYANYRDKSSWGQLILCYIVYALGMLAFIMTIVYYIPLAVVAIIGIFALLFIGRLPTGRSIVAPGIEVSGEGFVQGHYIGDGHNRFQGNNGWRYYYDGFKWLRE